MKVKIKDFIKVYYYNVTCPNCKHDIIIFDAEPEEFLDDFITCEECWQDFDVEDIR